MSEGEKVTPSKEAVSAGRTVFRRLAAFIAGERAGKGDDPEAVKEARAFIDAGEGESVVAGARKTHWSAEDPKTIAENFEKKEKTQNN